MKAYLGLGSNTGDRFGNLREAVRRLKTSTGIQVQRVSPVYETVAVGGPEQPDYLNAVIEVETDLEAEELLKSCLGIENEMGRTRTVRRGPRIIDIDIELYGNLVLKTNKLTIPHPLMHERAFVLKPLADIAPDYIHPILKLTVKELMARIEGSGVREMKNCELRIKN